MNTLLEYFKLGGSFMWILLVFSIITLALIIERSVYLIYHDCKVKKISSQVQDMIKNGEISEAKEMLKNCKRRKTVATVLYALLENAKFGENRMEKAAEGEAQERIRRMESGFSAITAMASLAPLTGFLGTVSGMIGAFKSIATATEVNAQLVAGGIYEALITTVYGLLIAIAASIAYNLFVQHVDNFAAETSKAVNAIVPLLLEKKEEK